MSTKIKQLTGRILRPLGRVLAKAIQVDDPWSRHPADIPAEKFGPGNIHEWSWYFGQRFFLDTVRKGGKRKMIFPIAKAAHFFCPEYSVDSLASQKA